MRAVSLFSNCGAGDIGYAAAGFKFEVMAEIERCRLDVALLNHNTSTGICGDLRATWSDVVREFRERAGSQRLALLSACPPCQGMSSARGRRGSATDADAGAQDDRNLLVLPIASVALALKPRVVVVENVPAFLRTDIRRAPFDFPFGQGVFCLSIPCRPK